MNAIQWRKDSLFNKLYGNNWIYTCKKMSLDTDLTLFKKRKTQNIHQRSKYKTPYCKNPEENNKKSKLLFVW